MTQTFSVPPNRLPRLVILPSDPLLRSDTRYGARLPEPPTCWLTVTPARVAQPVRFRPRRRRLRRQIVVCLALTGLLLALVVASGMGGGWS